MPQKTPVLSKLPEQSCLLVLICNTRHYHYEAMKYAVELTSHAFASYFQLDDLFVDIVIQSVPIGFKIRADELLQYIHIIPDSAVFNPVLSKCHKAVLRWPWCKAAVKFYDSLDNFQCSILGCAVQLFITIQIHLIERGNSIVKYRHQTCSRALLYIFLHILPLPPFQLFIFVDVAA